MLEKKKQLASKSAVPGAASKPSAMVKTLPAKKPSQTGASSKLGPKPVKSTVRPATDGSKSVAATETAKDKPPDAKIAKPNPKTSLPPKESRLKAFENSFRKIGYVFRRFRLGLPISKFIVSYRASMITNLDKSLQLVEEAKKSKAIRLQCSQRLKELYAEMQSVKQAVKQEELKLSRIQPEIQASHEIILSLKQKRHKLHTAAMDLGRGLRGDDYRYYHHQPHQRPERRGKAGPMQIAAATSNKRGWGKVLCDYRSGFLAG